MSRCVSSRVCRRLVALVGRCDGSRDHSLPDPRDCLCSQSHVVTEPAQPYVVLRHLSSTNCNCCQNSLVPVILLLPSSLSVTSLLRECCYQFDKFHRSTAMRLTSSTSRQSASTTPCVSEKKHPVILLAIS